jgi:hypothetical protein
MLQAFELNSCGDLLPQILRKAAPMADVEPLFDRGDNR